MLLNQAEVGSCSHVTPIRAKAIESERMDAPPLSLPVYVMAHVSQCFCPHKQSEGHHSRQNRT